MFHLSSYPNTASQSGRGKGKRVERRHQIVPRFITVGNLKNQSEDTRKERGEGHSGK